VKAVERAGGRSGGGEKGVGAEIEAVFIDAMHEAYAENRFSTAVPTSSIGNFSAINRPHFLKRH